MLEASDSVVVWLYNAGAKYPPLILLVVGFGVAYLVWFAINIIKREKEYHVFRTELNSLGESRDIVYNCLARAYSLWRQTYTDAPNDFTNFIDNEDFPEWLPVKRGNLIEVAAWHSVTRSRNTMDMWGFSFSIYREIESYKKQRQTLTLLQQSECEQLDKARRALQQFFQNTAYKIYKRHSLSYSRVTKHLEYNDPFLKIICYLSISLFVLNRQKGRGIQEMYQLGARFFKDN